MSQETGFTGVMVTMPVTLPLRELKGAFGDRLQIGVSLARYTSARVGGPADALLVVKSSEDLMEAVARLWEWNIPFLVLGGGSNVLVSDRGIRQLVLLNQARNIRFDVEAFPPTVWAESGVNFGALSRQVALKGLSGLEWAAGVPGTVGGAVVGNAGAHDGNVAQNLILADILHKKKGRVAWTIKKLEYSYRSSILKRNPGEAIVLAATFGLGNEDQEKIYSKMAQFKASRRRTQPPGASMGSIFKNPPGDFAGRLIEASGLKGTRIGGAEISSQHGNFFINHGLATAEDIWKLIDLAQKKVAEDSGVELELEIELLGDWPPTG